MTSRISPWCATLVWSTHGLVLAFFHMGRQFGASRPNTLACGLRKRPRSFLMGVTIVTPNNTDVQYPSIKSLRSTIVERSFYGASVFAERRSRTVSVPFRLSSVPFRFHSVLLANLRDQCEVSVNASFGLEDDLQLLQMVAEGSRYESASFCVAARAYSDPESRLINYARTQQRAKQREMLGLGHN